MKTRPSKYTSALLAKAQTYLSEWESLGDVVPMICSLAQFIGVNKNTLYTWEQEAKEEGSDKQEISDVCACVRELQEKTLINKGLSRESDASLSKLLLMKHGYSDRIEQDVKSSDGSMSPQASKEALNARLKELGIECD